MTAAEIVTYACIALCVAAAIAGHPLALGGLVALGFINLGRRRP